tara:strand:+ start:1021 stop:1716 length:696 start_codon:yes stop_codon:yes gene_type:complete
MRILEIIFPFLFCGLIFGLIFFIVLDPFGLAAKATAKVNQTLTQHWEHIAPQLEFQYDGTRKNKHNLVSPTLTGKIHQFNCRIWMEVTRSEGTDSHGQETVDFEVYLPQSLELDLSIGPQGTHIPFMKFLTPEELAVDDEIFDQHFFVQGKDAVAVNQFLTLERKTTILNASHSISPAILHVTDSAIKARLYGNATPAAQQIIHLMKQLVAIANTFYDEPEETVWESVDHA